MLLLLSCILHDMLLHPVYLRHTLVGYFLWSALSVSNRFFTPTLGHMHTGLRPSPICHLRPVSHPQESLSPTLMILYHLRPIISPTSCHLPPAKDTFPHEPLLST